MSTAAKYFRTSFSWIEWAVTFLLVCILASLFFAAIGCGCGGSAGQITKSIANCRQIIIAMRLYAADHAGAYPDSKVPSAIDSNVVFRELIKSGALEDEKIFGCGASRYTPDGLIGAAPEYADAVTPGENHWAMTKGLDDSSPGGIPLVFENPADATWSPTWNPDMAGRNVKGRTWSGGKVIIGTNDTSVELMKLTSPKGTRVPLKPYGVEGKNLFEQYLDNPDDTTYEILDIASEPSA
ncbi:hypothetical protein AYO49_00315 [Verrucomicrobiaceae bacterium SCGC AG-212-N21]|nr:hypothetical protein AYO49_00315 [Verrucomicrobiaceae bacterium SCGC AG-212-N21]